MTDNFAKMRAMSSPRAWGCFLLRQSRLWTVIGLPHVRGGVSERITIFRISHLSSPRAWGCFFLQDACTVDGKVFPTCVGVFLTISPKARQSTGLPHVRGGVSESRAGRLLRCRSSPRAWGCFSIAAGVVIAVKGFGSFDGNFIVEEARHSVSSSGYTTELRLRRVNAEY